MPEPIPSFTPTEAQDPSDFLLEPPAAENQGPQPDMPEGPVLEMAENPRPPVVILPPTPNEPAPSAPGNGSNEFNKTPEAQDLNNFLLDPPGEAETTVDSYETPTTLEGVVFQHTKNTRGDFEWSSSDPSRKKVKLDPDSPHTPQTGLAYDVEVVQDTNPNDANKGMLIVRLIEEKPEEETVPLALREREKNAKIPAIEFDYERGKVYILETELDINPEGGPLVPSPERFRHFTLDQNTLETLETIATAVSLGQPCFLEGDTATSKTSAIEYLAMITNNEVVRFNFNGQTDTSELIGKFVPNDSQLQIEFESLLQNKASLSPQSRIIIDAAQEAGRTLTEFESQKIAAQEGLAIPEWRWQDGAAPQAMRGKGKWLIYDEYGLGDPSVRERTNPALEKNPVLVLTEKGGEKIGGEEEPVGENFRMFGTNNPDYAGRIPLTPADRDRWTISKGVKSPSEDDYRAVAELAIFGEQPEVTVNGKLYKSEKTEPLYPKLGELEGIRDFAAKAAKLHHEISEMARTPGKLRRGSKETYTFTRRGFAEFFNYLENRAIHDRHSGQILTIENDPKSIILRALKLYYTDKIKDEADQQKITDLMEMVGMSEKKWLLNIKPKPVPPKLKSRPAAASNPAPHPRDEFMKSAAT